MVPMLTPSFGFPYLVFNTKEGVLPPIRPLRQAVQTAIGQGEMLAAGFGDTRFFIVEGNHFPKGTPYYSAAGTDALQPAQRQGRQGRGREGRLQGRADPHPDQPAVRLPLQHGAVDGRAAQARRLQGRPATWSTGPRCVQRRNDPKLWDVYITHSGLFPEPMLSPPQLGDGAPGWWGTPAKTGRAGGVQPRDRPGQARRAVGQGAAGRVRRGAVHQGRQVQRPVGAIARRSTATRPPPGRSSGTRA